MWEQIKIITEATIFYKKELITLFLFYIALQIITYFWTKCTYDKTTVHSQSTLSSETNLFHFRLKDPKISSNNTVYLKGFKSDGYRAIIQHAFYGIYLYFKELGNIINFLITLGMIYYYKRYINFIVAIGFMIQYVNSYVHSKLDLLKQQSIINNTNIIKLVDHYTTFKPKAIKQKSLKRGDLIKLNPGDIPPADILLVNLENKYLMTQELQLSGEDVVLQKSGLEISFNKSRYKIIINHHKNNGIVTDMITGKEYHYTEQNMVFCGMKIIDGSMIGVVIETGNDCAIYRIDNSVRKAKTAIQAKTDEIIVFNSKILFLFAIIFSFVIIYKEMLSKKHFWDYFFIMILLFNMLVPQSLQFFFQKASKMLSDRISQKHNLRINQHGYYSFQINPEEIVSDKTGTLTTNTLELADMFYNNKSALSHPDLDILFNILACTEIQPHSITGELLKNDVIEEKLLTHVCTKLKMKLKHNLIDQNGAGEIKIDDIIIDRLLYKKFDYKLEVKLGVIRYKGQMYLHIQGTPEAINKYSQGKLVKLMDELKNIPKPDNAYRRIIAHASREIDEKELELLKAKPELILNNMKNVSLYLFHDFIVKNVDKAVQKVLQTRNFTMLTGDKMSSAIEIGTLLGIINNHEIVDTLEDINKLDDKKVGCLILNGRLLDSLISSERVCHLITLMKKSNARIIYRATPTSKQLFVAFLQKYMKKTTMMIGDGSNDIPSIMQADIGVAVIGENKNIQNMAEIVIKEWPEILDYINSSIEMKQIISNVISWIIIRSMILAFSWLAMLMHSKFQKYSDPMNPVFTTLINAILYFCTRNYCSYENVPTNFRSDINIKRVLVKGAIIGFIEGWIIFTFFNVNTAVSLLVVIQVLQLIYMLYGSIQDKNKEIKKNFILILISFGLLNIVIHWVNKTGFLKI
jgi:magnesium-transporting ATPase (P-type)